MSNAAANQFSTVTELPGGRASRQQVAKLRHRYQLAARHSAGRDVLEVGCGAGLGLGWLARTARRVAGGDYCESNLATARGHYNGRVPLAQFDAASLPFCDSSFDVVVLFEALYYLRQPQQFIAECARILRPEGLVVIGTVNPEWSGFHPSPFAQRYFSAADLRQLLAAGGFSAEVTGSFRDTSDSARRRLVSGLKRAASRAGMIPKTMRGKEPLKRIFFGKLELLPAELVPHPAGPDGLGPNGNGAWGTDANGNDDEGLVALGPDEPSREYSVVYAFGRSKAKPG